MRVSKQLIKVSSGYSYSDGDTPLHCAARLGDPCLVKLFLDFGIDPNAENSYQRTPLHEAIYSENVKILEILINANGDVNAKDHKGQTPLHLAFKLKNIDTLNFLLQANVDVNAIDENGYTPLHEGLSDENFTKLFLSSEDVSEEYLNILKKYIHAGVEVNPIGKCETPLHVAVKRGNLSIVKLLLDSGANINSKNCLKKTPLQIAIEMKNKIITKLLLDYGANVNVTDHNGTTPLHTVSCLGEPNFMKLILGLGASVHAKDNNENTPLHHAAYSGITSYVRLLCDAGANINSKNNNNKTPLHNAVELNNHKIVELLLNSGADANAKDTFGSTPLMTVVRHSKSMYILKILLNAGADINANDFFFNTPLHWAVKLGDVSILKMLISFGADVTSCVYDILFRLVGEFSWKVYKSENFEKVLMLLFEHIDVNLVDTAGNNILVNILSKSKNTFETYHEIFFKHITKLAYQQLQLDDEIIQFIFSKVEYLNYNAQCVRELTKVKNTPLHNSWVTFYNLLFDCEYNLIKYAGNAVLIRSIEENIKKFPVFGCYIQNRIDIGIDTRKIYDMAANMLCCHLPIFDPCHLVVRNVLDVVKEEDWRLLCE